MTQYVINPSSVSVIVVGGVSYSPAKLNLIGPGVSGAAINGSIPDQLDVTISGGGGGGGGATGGLQTNAVMSDARSPSIGVASTVLLSDSQLIAVTSVPPGSSVLSDAATPQWGSSPAMLRSDAVFCAATAVPGSVDDSASLSQGSSTALARADHTHFLSEVGLRDAGTRLNAPLFVAGQQISNLGAPLSAGDAVSVDVSLHVPIANIPTGTTSTTVALGNDSRIVNAVPNTRTVSASTGLTGGGALSSNISLAVSYGTTAGTSAQGNDSRITGAEQTANRGVASGYASLDGSAHVPIAQIPTGTSSSTVAIGNDSRITGAEQTANKGVANGYASLNGSALIPIAQIPTGTTNTTVAIGNDSRITGAEQTVNKGAANGYASLNGSSQIPIAQIPTGTTSSTVALGNDSRITGAEQTVNKGAANGYASLNGSSLVPIAQIPTGTTGTTVALGNDSRITGAEQTSNKGTANGYASLDGTTHVPIAQIPTGTSSSTVAIGNDSRITGAEQTANKGVANGYAGLDGSSHVPISNLPTGFTSSSVVIGNDARLTRITVRVATTAALASNTYNNGTSGVGATLTATANGAIATQDGVTLAVNDRILVWNEATGANNGPYSVTQLGDASHPYILTRVTDVNTSALMLPMLAVGVSEGTEYGGRNFYLTTAATITIGTTALVFSVEKTRTAASGTSTIAASATVTLATVTRFSTEVFDALAFCTNQIAGIQVSMGSATPSGTDSISVWMEATANANEVALRARNNNSSSSRTIDYKLRGVIT